MALVPHRERRNQLTAALNGAVTARQAGQLLGDLVSAAQRMNLNKGRSKNSFDAKLGPPRRPRKKQDKAIGRPLPNPGGFPAVSIPRGLGGAQVMRTTLQSILGLQNSTSNFFSGAWGLGSATQNANGLYALFGATFMPRFYQISQLYRQFVLHSITLEFVPYISSTNSGGVTIAVDPDPSVPIPASFNACIQHRVSCMSDLQSKCVIRYDPLKDLKKDPRYCTGGSTLNRDDDETLYGVFELVSNNTLASGATIGYVSFTVDVSFIGPC
jgi:hypothetical protein